MSSKSVTVGEYSTTVVKKYLQHAFSDDPRENLSAAAEEVYVLLRKLMDASGDKSEDAKAPLKAIRNGIESFASSSPGTQPEVDALFSLLSRLEELCQDRVARGTDPGAAQVQDLLRYRLTRLLVGDTWDARPALKLRVLQLIFSFMVRENERLLEESRDVPNLKLAPALGRSLSIGRRGGGARDLGPRRHSKWQDALAEAGRMPGPKLLPLLKLLLMENLQLRGAAAAEAAPPAPAAAPAAPAAPAAAAAGQDATPATPGQLSPTKLPPASAAAATAAAGTLDDLLGLNDPAPSEAGDDAPSRRSSSPSPSTPGDDPFAALAEGRPGPGLGPVRGQPPAPVAIPVYQAYGPTHGQQQPGMQRGYGAPAGAFGGHDHGNGSGSYAIARPASPTGSTSSMQTSTFAPGVQTPPNYQPLSYFAASGPAPPVAIPATYQEHAGHYHPGHHPSHAHCVPVPSPGGLHSQGSGGVSPLASPMHAYGSAPTSFPSQYPSPGSGAGFPPLHPAHVAADHGKPPAAPMFPTNFDAASPYLGNPAPFEDSSFKDLSPVSAQRDMPPAPPQAPPMRTNSK